MGRSPDQHCADWLRHHRCLGVFLATDSTTSAGRVIQLGRLRIGDSAAESPENGPSNPTGRTPIAPKQVGHSHHGRTATGALRCTGRQPGQSG